MSLTSHNPVSHRVGILRWTECNFQYSVMPPLQPTHLRSTVHTHPPDTSEYIQTPLAPLLHIMRLPTRARPNVGGPERSRQRWSVRREPVPCRSEERTSGSPPFHLRCLISVVASRSCMRKSDSGTWRTRGFPQRYQGQRPSTLNL